MRTLPFLGALLLLSACEIKEKSQIKPMFEPKSLTELYGDGKAMTFNVKIPLGQDMVGSYDASEIMEDETIDEEKKPFFRKLWNGIKYGIYDQAVSVGISNRIKYSFDYEFPEIDSQYIKSVKVKRIFFALNNCSPDEVGCRRQETKREVTFKFLDQFFMNLSTVRPGEEDDLDHQEFIIEKKDFKKASDLAFSSTKKENYFEMLNDRGEVSDEYFRNVNLTRFENSRGYRKDDKVANGLSSVYIMKLRRDLLENEKKDILQHFRDVRYKNVVKDTTLIGNNFYIELTTPYLRDKFFQINAENSLSAEGLGLTSFQKCDQSLCADLDVEEYNLVPMLERSNRIRFDTYLSLKKLEMNDFQYNGYVELEVKLDLGI